MAETHPQGTQARWADDQGTDQRGQEILVLDASVAIAWVFDDGRGQVPAALLDRIAVSLAVVPAHWILEVTNGLLLAARRGRLRRPDEDIEILERLGTLAVRVDPETATRGWGATPFLARRLGLTTYDAAYLELAGRLQAPLATLDTGLARAARNAGVRLVTDELAPPA